MILENVNWISGVGSKSDGSYYFRKEFVVEFEIKRATLYICAVGLGVCTINGKSVTDEVYTTPFTRYDKRLIYREFDVTDKILDKNAIGIHVGNGFYNNNMKVWNENMATYRDTPKVAIKLVITKPNGAETVVESDETWTSTAGPCVYNMMRQGEIYDARLIKKGFDAFGFDDCDWSKATYTAEPGGILEPMDMPPVKVCKVIKPVSLNNGIYDFGSNMSGRTKIILCGESGQEVTLEYDEAITDDGNMRGRINEFINYEGLQLTNKDIFVCSGKKDEYAPEFCYHGFRYVKVKNAPKDFEIAAEFIHTDLEQVGSFVCSDEMLNKIHDASVQATLSNYMGIPTDCPHREQNGWTGDALLSAEQALMNFDMNKAYKKWMKDFSDCQRLSGQLPGIVPTSNWGYNWGSGPAWDSALILIPWYVYQNTGDLSVIKIAYESMISYMKYLKKRAVGYIADFGLGDWCPINWDDVCPRGVTDTAYYYADSIVMGKASKLLGHESNAFFEQAKKIKKAWREKFWCEKSLQKFQTFYACAIYQGLLNDDEIKSAVDKLASLVIENDYHINCGILGTKYIFTALSENGYMDVVYKMVTNPTFPSYAYWIKKGMTTLCESWNMDSSLNHHMFSEVDNWLYKYVGGINISENGVVIKPLKITGLDWVTVEHRGIKVARAGDKVNISIPKKATIVVGKNKFEADAGNYSVTF